MNIVVFGLGTTVVLLGVGLYSFYISRARKKIEKEESDPDSDSNSNSDSGEEEGDSETKSDSSQVEDGEEDNNRKKRDDDSSFSSDVSDKTPPPPPGWEEESIDGTTTLSEDEDDDEDEYALPPPPAIDQSFSTGNPLQHGKRIHHGDLFDEIRAGRNGGFGLRKVKDSDVKRPMSPKSLEKAKNEGNFEKSYGGRENRAGDSFLSQLIEAQKRRGMKNGNILENRKIQPKRPVTRPKMKKNTSPSNPPVFGDLFAEIRAGRSGGFGLKKVDQKDMKRPLSPKSRQKKKEKKPQHSLRTGGFMAQLKEAQNRMALRRAEKHDKDNDKNENYF